MVVNEDRFFQRYTASGSTWIVCQNSGAGGECVWLLESQSTERNVMSFSYVPSLARRFDTVSKEEIKNINLE